MFTQVRNAILSNTVNRENFIELQDQLCFDERVIQANTEWESRDAEWKEALKNKEEFYSVLNKASKVRVARELKDQVFDIAAHLAGKLADEMNIIEEYTEDTLGSATKVGEVEELSLDWHNLRRQGVGGSSLSEALGFHWMSRPGDPVMMKKAEQVEFWKQLAAQKSAEVVVADNPKSGVLFRGHQWEPSLIVRYALENDVRVAVSKATWQGSHPLQIINVDGIILDKDGNPEGLLECKTSSREWTWNWGVPLHYRAQVLWYLRATGLEYAVVMVKFDTGYIKSIRIYADETIDGSERTKGISFYIGELERNWEKYVQPMKDDPRLVWSQDGALYDREKRINDVLPKYRATGALRKVLDTADVVKTTVVAPYERMRSYYNILTSFHTSNMDEPIYLDGVSPSLYPLDKDYVFAELEDREETHVEDFVHSNKVLAVDDMTYDFLVKRNGWPGVINLSDVRRIVVNNPNYPDFVSVKDAEDWIVSYLEST